MAGLRANLAGIHTVHDYLAQHWQGGFTLGYAFWVNAGLLGLLADLLFAGLDQGVETLSLSGHREAAAGLLLLGLAADLPILVWQFVGVARSAAAHEARGGRRIWAFLTRCLLVVLLIGVPFLIAEEVSTLRGLLG